MYCSPKKGGTSGTCGIGGAYRVLVRKREGDQLEDLGVEGRLQLVSTLNRRRSRGEDWTGSVRPWIQTSGRLL